MCIYKMFNKFIKQQYEFRRNHSTQDILTTLHINISDSIKMKQHTIFFVLHLKKAYNMVWKNKVIDILTNNISLIINITQTITGSRVLGEP